MAASAELGDWRRVFEDPTPRPDFAPLEVEGRLPQDLRGVLVRNGPALSTALGLEYEHWFDGDGGLVAVRLDGTGAEGALRLVQTEGLRQEQSKARRIHAGFGTRGASILRPPWRPKNAANTNVLSWQGRLLALWEAGLPHEVDPRTLESRGAVDLGGVVPSAFSAHPHRVEARGATYNFGLRYTWRGSVIDLFELPDVGAARCIGRVKLPGRPMLHDFIATERHLVFFVSPTDLDTADVLLRGRPFGRALRWRPELGTDVIVVPIDEPAAVVRFHVDPFYQWHFTNAYEAGDRIEIDFVRYDEFELVGWRDDVSAGNMGNVGRHVRASLDPSRAKMTMREWGDDSVEFARVAPRVGGGPHRYIYSAVASDAARRHGMLFDGIAKLDTERGALTRLTIGEGIYPAEPVFVPRPGHEAEDDGWLLSVAYDANRHRSQLLVLDARRLEDGPLARASFPSHVHFTFHGDFIPQASS